MQRDQRLARADIALQQPQHRRRSAPCRRRSRAIDAPLRAGQRVGQLELVAQLARARQRRRAAPPLRLAHQQERELVGEHLVIGEPPARGLGAAVRDGSRERLAPAAPALAREQARLDPFGQLGRALERLAHQLAEPAVGQPLGQRIDRLADLPAAAPCPARPPRDGRSAIPRHTARACPRPCAARPSAALRFAQPGLPK